jgi:hypothetical protein
MIEHHSKSGRAPNTSNVGKIPITFDLPITHRDNSNGGGKIKPTLIGMADAFIAFENSS